MSTAGSDLDKAAELFGTVKQFLKVIEGRTGVDGQVAGAAQGAQKELGHSLGEESARVILLHVEDAASAGPRPCVAVW